MRFWSVRLKVLFCLFAAFESFSSMEGIRDRKDFIVAIQRIEREVSATFGEADLGKIKDYGE